MVLDFRALLWARDLWTFTVNWIRCWRLYIYWEGFILAYLRTTSIPHEVKWNETRIKWYAEFRLLPGTSESPLAEQNPIRFGENDIIVSLLLIDLSETCYWNTGEDPCIQTKTLNGHVKKTVRKWMESTLQYAYVDPKEDPCSF